MGYWRNMEDVTIMLNAEAWDAAVAKAAQTGGPVDYDQVLSIPCPLCWGGQRGVQGMHTV